MSRRGNPNYGKYLRMWQEQKKQDKEFQRMMDEEDMKERREEVKHNGKKEPHIFK